MAIGNCVRCGKTVEGRNWTFTELGIVCEECMAKMKSEVTELKEGGRYKGIEEVFSCTAKVSKCGNSYHIVLRKKDVETFNLNGKNVYVKIYRIK